MVDPSESWGCYTCRPCCNLLSGSLPVPAGDRCAAEFVLFDTKDKVPYLCRYADGSRHVSRLDLQPAPSNPRQLLLSSRLRLLASLEVAAGAASVLLWHLGQPQRLDLTFPDLRSAKAICWAHRNLPPWAPRDGELLSVLLADRVLLLPLVAAGTSFSIGSSKVLQINFPCRSLCWSQDGSQLLVGGKGQLVCFAWRPNEEEPLVRHLLSSGDCVEIHGVFSNGFLCRIDQCAVAPPETQLLLPGGPPQVQTNLVQVIENPQDGPSESPTSSNIFSIPGGASTTLGSAWQNPITEVAAGLQVVPCQRYLMPIRCSITKDGGVQQLRLHCGTELEGNEVVAVAESGGRAVVAHGSFSSSEVCCHSLAPPHQWKGRCWQQLGTFCLAESLRLSGLALWPGASGAPELHALLSQAPAPGDFGRPQRELFHRTQTLSDSKPADTESQAADQELAATSPTDRNEALLSIAHNVAGMREEMGKFRETFESFRHDFSRLVLAIEQLAEKKAT